MPYAPPSLRLRSGTSYSPLSATGITALDSTTKVALAAWIHFTPGSTASGELFYQANQTTPRDGVTWSIVTGNGLRLRTFNAGANTTLLAPPQIARYLGTGIPIHVLVMASSVTGFCDWYLNAIPCGRSSTTVAAWTISGTRVTGLGSYTATTPDFSIADLRVWAQNDADVVLATPRMYAKLAMQGRPAGESARWVWGSPTSGTDQSGHGRTLTFTAPSATQVGTTAPAIVPFRTRYRRTHNGFVAAAAGGAKFKPWFH
jgi:hypothetical protein